MGRFIVITLSVFSVVLMSACVCVYTQLTGPLFHRSPYSSIVIPSRIVNFDVSFVVMEKKFAKKFHQIAQTSSYLYEPTEFNVLPRTCQAKRNSEQCHKIRTVFFWSALQNGANERRRKNACNFTKSLPTVFHCVNGDIFFCSFSARLFPCFSFASFFIILHLLCHIAAIIHSLQSFYIIIIRRYARARCCQRPQMPRRWVHHLILLKRCRSTDGRTRTVHCRPSSVVLWFRAHDIAYLIVSDVLCIA